MKEQYRENAQCGEYFRRSDRLMILYRIVIGLMFVLFLFCSHAAVSFAEEALPAGYRVLSRSEADGIAEYLIENPEGSRFQVSSHSTADGADAQSIRTVEKLSRLFSRWEGLEIAELRFVIRQGRVEAFVIPASLSYGEVDLAPYIPSGMQFLYTDSLEYDFRLKVDMLFLRVRGQFYDIEQFCTKLHDAVSKPYAYIQSHDPEYLVRKSSELERKIEAGINERKVLFQQQEVTDSEFLRAYEEASSSLAGLGDRADGLQASLDLMRASFEQAEAEQRQLTEAHRQLRQELEILRSAVIALNNRNLFGTIRETEEQDVLKVLELKQKHPGYGRKELTEALKEDGIKLSSREIELILATYFGEF